MRFSNRLGKIVFGAMCLILSGSIVLSAYTATVTMTENGTSAYTMVSAKKAADVAGWASNGFISSTGLDVQLLKGSTALPLMLADDAYYFADSISSGGTNNYTLSTGNTPVTSMPIILGSGGYVTTADAANLEPGNNFNLEFDGYIDTSAGADKNLAYKDDSFQFYVSGAGSLTAAIIQPGTETETNSSYGSTVIKLYAGFTDIGQTFTFTNTVTIDAINLKLFESGSPTGTFSYNLYATSAGEITGSPIATGSVDVTTLPSSDDWMELELDDSITLTGGVMYGVWPKYDGGNSSNYVGLSYYSTSSNYSGGTRLYSSDGGASWTTHTTDINFSISGTYYNNKTVTANGVTSGEYKVNVTADGTNFKIYLDDVQAATTALSGASVPNNANSWVFFNSAAVPYLDYYKHTTGGTLRLTYQPDSIILGTDLLDMTNSFDGVITWGTNPAGLSVSMLSFRPDDTSSTTTTTGTTPGVGTGVDPITNTTSVTSGTFLDPIVAIFVTASDGALNTETAWWGFYFMVLMVVIVLVYAKFQHLVLAAAGAILVSIAFCVGLNVIPDVMLALMVAFLIGAILIEIRQTV